MRRLRMLADLMPIFAIVTALVVGAVFIYAAGKNPWLAYYHMFRGAFGGPYAVGETLSRFVPLAFCALGFAVGFKTGVFNAGAEGQLYMGALAATLVGTLLHGIPSPIHILLAILAGFLLASLWGSIAALFRVWVGANELITTIMLNYIAILFVDLLLVSTLKDPAGMVEQSRKLEPSALLPYLVPGSRLHLGVVLALASVVAVYYLLWRTPLGYSLRFVGENPSAAKYAGVDVSRAVIVAMIVSAGLAGIGGAAEVMGSQHRLMRGFSPGYGFDGIAAAVMAKENPFGVILTSLLFAVLRVGAGAMQRQVGVPLPLVNVIQGMVVILVIASSFFSRNLSSVVKAERG